jgi:succinoglycan biosynthesis protein ExoA
LNRPTQRVAVIIPCRNERRHIARCLDSLLANDYPCDLMDVVIVDGMSTDGTRRVVEQYASRHPFIRLLDNPQKSKPAALNLGVAATDSDVVMRLDAHAVYPPNYVSKLVRGLVEHQADNIGGVRRTDPGSTPWSRAVSVVISHPLAAGNAVYRTGVRDKRPRQVGTVFCGCYRRDVFRRIGGFHPDLLRTQDREFNARLIAAGGKIVLDPFVECCYYPRCGLADYVRWVFAGGFWVYYADCFTNTKMRSWRNWVPPLFVLWHLIVALVCLASPLLALLAAVPLALYWAVTITCSAAEAARHRTWQLFPSLMILFPLTHWAYGLGSWCGKASSCLRRNRTSSPPRLSPAPAFRNTA